MLLRVLLPGIVLACAWPAAAQNWIPGINPGFVRGPVTAVLPAQPVVVQSAPVVVVPPAQIIILPDRTPGSRVGPGFERPEKKAPAVRTVRPRVYVYPATGVNPYVYPYVYQSANPYLVGPGGGAVYSGIVPAVGVGADIAGQGPYAGPRSEIRAPGPAGISIGTPRREVIRILGRPHAAVYRSSGRETLMFGGTTIYIENGVVAVIQ